MSGRGRRVSSATCRPPAVSASSTMLRLLIAETDCSYVPPVALFESSNCTRGCAVDVGHPAVMALMHRFPRCCSARPRRDKKRRYLVTKDHRKIDAVVDFSFMLSLT